MIKFFRKIRLIQLGLGFIIGLLMLSCKQSPENVIVYDYGTKSDSARYYFQKGWEEILDNGRWTESEIAFRKAMDFDPEWPVGKSLVGRITRDLNERQKLLQELNQIKEQTTADERLLLDIFMPSMKAMNNRDQGIRSTPEAGKNRRAVSETNFRKFAHKHPEESYIKAEYIEVLHANHGAQTALDSLNALASEDQMTLGFYISYKATLELELGHFDAAISLLQQLKSSFPDPTYTSSYMLQAQIYMAQDSLPKASELVNKVVSMDPNHLIAVGMQSRINKALKEQ